MDNSSPPPIPSTIVNRTVLRRPNAELRTREHLTAQEVESLIEAAGANRQGHRDALMILLAFRHGLRASEVCDLRWEQVDFKAATLHVRRTKGGTPATHPLTGRELRALRRHQRPAPGEPSSLSVSVVPRFPPLGSRAWSNAGLTANLGIKVHAHMLRLPAALPSQIAGSIRGRCKLTWVTPTSRTPRDIPRWQRGGLKGSGGTSPKRGTFGSLKAL
jgi:type 1 fimbriae regulatory protein FimB/type 1 fimbriae regulatory protein FimE